MMKKSNGSVGAMTPEEIETRQWGKAGFSVIDVGEPPARPLFSQIDYAVVSQAVLRLSWFERELIVQRFWKGLDSALIAKQMGVDVARIESRLDQIYAKLKRFCENHAYFSRTKVTAPLPLAA